MKLYVYDQTQNYGATMFADRATCTVINQKAEQTTYNNVLKNLSKLGQCNIQSISKPLNRGDTVNVRNLFIIANRCLTRWELPDIPMTNAVQPKPLNIFKDLTNSNDNNLTNNSVTKPADKDSTDKTKSASPVDTKKNNAKDSIKPDKVDTDKPDKVDTDNKTVAKITKPVKKTKKKTSKKVLKISSENLDKKYVAIISKLNNGNYVLLALNKISVNVELTKNSNKKTTAKYIKPNYIVSIEDYQTYGTKYFCYKYLAKQIENKKMKDYVCSPILQMNIDKYLKKLDDKNEKKN